MTIKELYEWAKENDCENVDVDFEYEYYCSDCGYDGELTLDMFKRFPDDVIYNRVVMRWGW